MRKDVRSDELDDKHEALDARFKKLDAKSEARCALKRREDLF